MKKVLVTIALLVVSLSGFSQTKKDGTPDMRYSANKQAYGSSYTAPKPVYRETTQFPSQSSRTYDNGGQLKFQEGYQKKDGSYVLPHYKTKPDNNPFNNLKKKND